MAKIEFYFDEMMPRGVARALLERGIAVTMAVDVAMTEKDDIAEHLNYAAVQHQVLVTRDKPFATKAMSIENHAGVICWTGGQNDVGGMVRLLTEFAQQYTTEDVVNRVFWRK